MTENNKTLKWRISLLVVFAILAGTGFLLSIVKGSVEIPLSEIMASVGGSTSQVYENIFMFLNTIE